MPVNENDEFMSVEDELSKVLDHLSALKQEEDKYESAALQLDSGQEALVETGGKFNEQCGKVTGLLAAVTEQLQAAVVALRPLGTEDIAAAMQEMEDRVEKLARDVEGQLDSVHGAAVQISESAAATLAMPSQVTEGITEVLAAQSSQVLKSVSDVNDQSVTQSEALTKRVESLERLIHECRKETKDQADRLLEAIEHSAPIGIFRKKKK